MFVHRINLSQRNTTLQSKNNEKTIQQSIPHKNQQFFGAKLQDMPKVYASSQMQNTTKTALKIWKEIADSKNIVILVHKFSDGDAISSGLSLQHIIQSKFKDKNVSFVVPMGVPSAFKNLPGASSIKTTGPNPKHKYTAILLDCDETHVDGFDIYKNAAKRINLDHHSTNVTKKGTSKLNALSIVDEKSTSTTELLLNKLFKPLNFNIDSDKAECLLTGLYTDSGGFTHAPDLYDAVDTRDYLVNLMQTKHTDPMSKIISNMKDSQYSTGLQMMQAVCSHPDNVRRTITKDSNVLSYVVIDDNVYKRFGITDSMPDTKAATTKIIFNILHNEKPIKPDIAAVFLENPLYGEVSVSLKSHILNVKDFAFENGGGGHNNASGFYLKGKAKDIVPKVVKKIELFDFE